MNFNLNINSRHISLETLESCLKERKTHMNSVLHTQLIYDFSFFTSIKLLNRLSLEGKKILYD